MNSPSIYISLKTRHVIVGGEARYIGGIAYQILWLLMTHHRMDTKDLIENIYSYENQPLTAKACIRVAVLALRIALFQSGWEIGHTRTRGYFLERRSAF